MKKTILAVDDNTDSRMIFAALLQYAGYAVVEAKDGEQAVRFARDHMPDLILMDLFMPVVNGWEAAEWLRRDPRTRDIPVFGCTVYDLTSEEEARLHHSGMERLLRKPVEPSRFVSLVEERIGPPMRD